MVMAVIMRVIVPVGYMFMRVRMLMTVIVLVVSVFDPRRERNCGWRLRVEQSTKQQHQHRAA
jgi:hypothetical protein